MSTVKKMMMVLLAVSSLSGFAISGVQCTDTRLGATVRWNMLDNGEPNFTVELAGKKVTVNGEVKVSLERKLTRLAGCLRYSASMDHGQSASLVDCGEGHPFGSMQFNLPDPTTLLVDCQTY